MATKLKILYINSVLDYGSTGRITRSLATTMKKQGHEVSVIYGRNKIANEEGTIYIGNKVGQAVHLIMSRIFGTHGLHSSFSTLKAIRHIRKFKPDIVHLHNIHGYYINSKMLLKYLSRNSIKTILTLHDAWLISGNSAYFDYHGCKVWDDGCVVCNSTHDYPKSLLNFRQRKNFSWKKKILTSFDTIHIITPSKWLESLIKNSFLKKYPTKVVNNGIDVSVFNRKSNVIRNNKTVLAIANIWEPRKGLHDVIEISKRLPKEYRLKIVGDLGDQEDIIPTNVEKIKRTDSIKELATLYSEATVFINPTYEDNYPTTNLEALACGTPVIAYDTGGNKEVPGIQIVPQGDFEEMIKMILKQNSRINIPLDVYSTETFLDSMQQVYNHIIAR